MCVYIYIYIYIEREFDSMDIYSLNPHASERGVLDVPAASCTLSSYGDIRFLCLMVQYVLVVSVSFNQTRLIKLMNKHIIPLKVTYRAATGAATDNATGDSEYLLRAALTVATPVCNQRRC